MIGRKIVLEKGINGKPQLENFKLIEETMEDLKAGEILIKAEWISADPFTRLALNSLPVGDVVPGAQVGRVVKSKCDEFPVGSEVIGRFGWRDLTLYMPQVNGSRSWISIDKVEGLGGLPSSYALGVLGMPGNTAYFGTVEVIDPQPGKTLLVSTASGAIGSLVGQIGKIKGCKVIALTGSDDKMDWLKNDLGFDIVLNYKKFASIEEGLKSNVPHGIDYFFDNVGGEFTGSVMRCMNEFGRVAQCGSMESCNEESAAHLKIHIDPLNIRMKNLSLIGFNTGRWADSETWGAGVRQMRDWILEGKIRVRESLSFGFETIPQAFLDMLHGKNIGKQIIRC